MKNYATFVILLMPLTVMTLSGCWTPWQREQELLPASSLRSIVLTPQTVQTPEGPIQLSQTAIWHSHQSQTELQDRLVDALHALEQSRNR